MPALRDLRIHRVRSRDTTKKHPLGCTNLGQELMMTKQVRLPALFCRPLQAGALLGVLPLLIASHVQAVELSLMD